MKCFFCSKPDTKVINTRFTSNLAVRRRRECNDCQKRFTTYERVEDFSVQVLKQDGSKEAFDERKIAKGLMAATEKRNVSQEILDSIVTNIQKEVEDSGKNFITSKKLGLMVMNRIKDIDKIAYIRFASVYKNFDNLDHFIDEIDQIRK